MSLPCRLAIIRLAPKTVICVGGYMWNIFTAEIYRALTTINIKSLLLQPMQLGIPFSSILFNVIVRSRCWVVCCMHDVVINSHLPCQLSHSQFGTLNLVSQSPFLFPFRPFPPFFLIFFPTFSILHYRTLAFLFK